MIKRVLPSLKPKLLTLMPINLSRPVNVDPLTPGYRLVRDPLTPMFATISGNSPGELNAAYRRQRAIALRDVIEVNHITRRSCHSLLPISRLELHGAGRTLSEGRIQSVN
jgi:hypothetical protein